MYVRESLLQVVAIQHTHMHCHWTIFIPGWPGQDGFEPSRRTFNHNFDQDWGIWLKFCTLVQNDTVNWITWPKVPPDQNSRWRRPPFWI